MQRGIRPSVIGHRISGFGFRASAIGYRPSDFGSWALNLSQLPLATTIYPKVPYQRHCFFQPPRAYHLPVRSPYRTFDSPVLVTNARELRQVRKEATAALFLGYQGAGLSPAER